MDDFEPFDRQYQEQYKALKSKVLKTIWLSVSLLPIGFVFMIFSERIGLSDDMGMQLFFACFIGFWLVFGYAIAIQRCPKCNGFLWKWSMEDGVHVKCGVKLF